MSAILEGTPDKRLALVTGRAYPELANEVAQYLGINVLPTTAYDFANGEMYVRFAEPVRGADVFVLQCHTNPINKWVMEQLLMIDALKRASAKSITVVAPFLGYSRQDKKHQGREPITARLMFDLFRTAGANRLVTVDLHAAQEQGFFDGPVDHLTAMPVLIDYVRSHVPMDKATIVSPGAPARVHPQDSRHHAPEPRRSAWHHRRRAGARLRGGGRHDRHRRHNLRGRAHTAQLRRRLGDSGRHAWSAVWPGRGAPARLRRPRNHPDGHCASAAGEAPG